MRASGALACTLLSAAACGEAGRPAAPEPARAPLTSVAESCGIDVDCSRGVEDGYTLISDFPSIDAYFASAAHLHLGQAALAAALDAQLAALRADAEIAEGLPLEVELGARIVAGAGTLSIAAEPVDCSLDSALEEAVRLSCTPADAPECIASTAAELSLLTGCRAPRLSIEHGAAPPDATEQDAARFELALTALRRRLPALLATAAKARLVLDATGLLVTSTTEVASSVQSSTKSAAHDGNLARLFGAVCAVQELGGLAHLLEAPSERLRARLEQVDDLAAAFEPSDAGTEVEP